MENYLSAKWRRVLRAAVTNPFIPLGNHEYRYSPHHLLRAYSLHPSDASDELQGVESAVNVQSAMKGYFNAVWEFRCMYSSTVHFDEVWEMRTDRRKCVGVEELPEWEETQAQLAPIVQKLATPRTGKLEGIMYGREKKLTVSEKAILRENILEEFPGEWGTRLLEATLQVVRSIQDILVATPVFLTGKGHLGRDGREFDQMVLDSMSMVGVDSVRMAFFAAVRFIRALSQHAQQSRNNSLHLFLQFGLGGHDWNKRFRIQKDLLQEGRAFAHADLAAGLIGAPPAGKNVNLDLGFYITRLVQALLIMKMRGVPVAMYPGHDDVYALTGLPHVHVRARMNTIVEVYSKIKSADAAFKPFWTYGLPITWDVINKLSGTWTQSTGKDILEWFAKQKDKGGLLQKLSIWDTSECRAQRKESISELASRGWVFPDAENFCSERCLSPRRGEWKHEILRRPDSCSLAMSADAPHAWLAPVCEKSQAAAQRTADALDGQTATPGDYVNTFKKQAMTGCEQDIVETCGAAQNFEDCIRETPLLKCPDSSAYSSSCAFLSHVLGTSATADAIRQRAGCHLLNVPDHEIKSVPAGQIGSVVRDYLSLAHPTTSQTNSMMKCILVATPPLPKDYAVKEVWSQLLLGDLDTDTLRRIRKDVIDFKSPKATDFVATEMAHMFSHPYDVDDWVFKKWLEVVFFCLGINLDYVKAIF